MEEREGADAAASLRPLPGEGTAIETKQLPKKISSLTEFQMDSSLHHRFVETASGLVALEEAGCEWRGRSWGLELERV